MAKKLRARDFRNGVDLAIKRVGTKEILAELLGIKVQSINHWRRVPRGRVMKIHELTGIPLRKLAPDLFQ